MKDEKPSSFFFAPGTIESRPRRARALLKAVREWLIVVLIFIGVGLLSAFLGGRL